MPNITHDDLSKCIRFLEAVKTHANLTSAQESDIKEVISTLEKYREKWVVKAIATSHNTAYTPGTIIELGVHTSKEQAKDEMHRQRDMQFHNDGDERWFYYVTKKGG